MDTGHGAIHFVAHRSGCLGCREPQNDGSCQLYVDVCVCTCPGVLLILCSLLPQSTGQRALRSIPENKKQICEKRRRWSYVQKRRETTEVALYLSSTLYIFAAYFLCKDYYEHGFSIFIYYEGISHCSTC